MQLRKVDDHAGIGDDETNAWYVVLIGQIMEELVVSIFDANENVNRQQEGIVVFLELQALIAPSSEVFRSQDIINIVLELREVVLRPFRYFVILIPILFRERSYVRRPTFLKGDDYVDVTLRAGMRIVSKRALHIEVELMSVAQSGAVQAVFDRVDTPTLSPPTTGIGPCPALLRQGDHASSHPARRRIPQR